MPPPAFVRLPMQMHIGAPCTPCVAVGDAVLVGQKIGDSEALFSAPVHASVSGRVTEITEISLGGGAKSQAVIIESDGEMKEIPHTPPKLDTYEDFIGAVRECGLVGLGGAGFPTHVKLRPSILNGIVEAASIAIASRSHIRTGASQSGTSLSDGNSKTRPVIISTHTSGPDAFTRPERSTLRNASSLEGISPENQNRSNLLPKRSNEADESLSLPLPSILNESGFVSSSKSA